MTEPTAPQPAANPAPGPAGEPPQKRRLGRGLNALLGGSGPAAPPAGGPKLSIHKPEEDADAGEMRHVPVGDVEASPFQPRRDFDGDDLNDLVGSVREHGVLSPVLVREIDGGFQLVAGERRLRAARKAGLETVPVRVVDVVDQTACEYALEENLKRSDLNDVEKARAFKRYLDQFQVTKEDLAKSLSMSRSAVANLLRLLDLPEPVRAAVEAGQISGGHAKAILGLDEEADMLELCGRVRAEGLSVRKAEAEVRRIRDEKEGPAVIPIGGAKKPSRSKGPRSRTPHVVQIEGQLRESLGVNVAIACNAKNKGKITIPFADNAEFERLLAVLRPPAAKAA